MPEVVLLNQTYDEDFECICKILFIPYDQGMGMKDIRHYNDAGVQVLDTAG